MAPGEMQDAEQVDRGDVATKLNSFAALKVMSPTDLNQLADKIIVRPFKVGDRLQEAQSSGDFLYLVESGTLRETGKDSAGTVCTTSALPSVVKRPTTACSKKPRSSRCKKGASLSLRPAT